MKLVILSFLLPFIILVSGQNIIPTAKEEIYKTIITIHGQNNIFWINETIDRIYNYDVDGNYEKWFYRSKSNSIADSSNLSATAACVVPIKYESTILSYLHTNHFIADTTYLFNQLNHFSLDSLRNYVAGLNTISYTKAPLSNTPLRNLLKKKKAIGLSPILFDNINNLAFVKMQTYSRRKQVQYDPSVIIILQKTDNWQIIKTLKMQQ